jgi:hypothetical protein
MVNAKQRRVSYFWPTTTGLSEERNKHITEWYDIADRAFMVSRQNPVLRRILEDQIRLSFLDCNRIEQKDLFLRELRRWDLACESYMQKIEEDLAEEINSLVTSLNKRVYGRLMFHCRNIQILSIRAQMIRRIWEQQNTLNSYQKFLRDSSHIWGETMASGNVANEQRATEHSLFELSLRSELDVRVEM